MKNSFIKITKEEFKKLNNGMKEDFYIVLNCQNFQTWEQLAEALGNAFQFPMRNEGFDGTWDWLTDFTWLELKDGVPISIYFLESDELLKTNQSLKKQVFDFFEEVIKFWKEDVKSAFIGGKPGVPRQFNIYLVN